MSRIYITFSVDWDNVEADILPSSRREIQEMIEASPLAAADVMSDISGISRTIYNETVLAMRAHWGELRKAARDD